MAASELSAGEVGGEVGGAAGALASPVGEAATSDGARAIHRRPMKMRFILYMGATGAPPSESGAKIAISLNRHVRQVGARRV
jgi:hypothetical protein